MDSSKTATYVVLSAVLSVLIHLFLLGLSGHMALRAFACVPVQPNKYQKKLTLHFIDPRDTVFRRTVSKASSKKTVAELRRIVNSKELDIKKIFEEQKLLVKPKPRLRLAGLGSNVLVPKIQPPKPRDLRAPRPKIVEIDAKKLPNPRLALPRRFTPKLARKSIARKVVPSLVAGSDFQNPIGKTYGVSLRLGLPSLNPLSVGPLPPDQQGKQGANGGRGVNRLGPVTALPELPPLKGGTNRGTGPGEIHQLDQLLDVKFVVYPLPDGSGFFRADITPNPRSESLPPVPKDVLFLIDCSTSISQPKLDQFKAATLEALQYLNPNDGFNVVSFNDHPRPLFSTFRRVTPENIALAKRFVTSLVRGGMTDIYAGLSPFVGSDRPATRPLNIFLLSDGITTVKDSPRNAELIRKIVNLNRANVSIYSFSAGRHANRFLLDLLAYDNRGKSLHEKRLSGFRPQLVRFISTHSELIVADLEYHITGGLSDEIYPKRLPHLYRGETLAIYGRYPAGTKELALSLVGRGARGKLQELIFKEDVTRAPRASARLAVEWASQKLYYLISLNTLRPSPALVAQIRAISNKYRLYVPYL